MTKDASRGNFYFGNYGKETPDDTKQNISVIVCDSEFKIIDEIYPDMLLNDIQGISFCEARDVLYFADGAKIYEMGLDGGIISEITIAEYAEYKPNGVLYDDRDDSIWVLCYTGYLLHISLQDRENGRYEIVDVIDCSFQHQDQLCFDENHNILFSVGADYNGDENYVGCIDVHTHEVSIMYQVRESYAVEGLFVDGGVLYVVNDGIYHSAKYKKNYIAQYRLP